MINLNDLTIGQTIAFKSISQYDNVEWRGVIVGFGDYNLIRSLQDVLPYYQNVKKTKPDILPIDRLNYVILDVYENTKTTVTNRRVFAKEWMDVSSLKIVNVHNYIDVRVFNVEQNQLQTILDLLNSNGYSCGQLHQ